MANTTDFISAVYDELAKILSISDSNPAVAMQMAWPGYALSPADFKRTDAPNGPYDPEVAKEALAQLANIAPLMSRARFENSGFEVDDLYEILISSAIPFGATQPDLPGNPIYRLFSEAQFELAQARRGVHDDPNGYYYPCAATPTNWYDEGATANWQTISLKQGDVKPATPASSPFVRSGGLDVAKSAMWRLKITEGPALAASLQKALSGKAAVARSLLKPAAPASPVAPAAALFKPALGRNIVPIPGKAAAPIDRARAPVSVESLNQARSKAGFIRPALPVNTVQTRLGQLPRVDMTKRDLGVAHLADRLVVKQLLTQQMPAVPASPATDGFSIVFRYCRVTIDRPWLKLALLSTKNWWMFDTPAGEYSTGDGAANPGMFPLLTTSFIVIRDLEITANWSPEDRQNLGSAASFGFFDVRDSTIVQNTLKVKGMQIIAWISRVTPKLPPLSPP